MGLFEDWLNAAGGLDRWQQFSRFTLHMSLNGKLADSKGKGGLACNIVVEGSTQAPNLSVTGFTGSDRLGLYRPGRVAIEHANGQLLEERYNPRLAFAKQDEAAAWDDLQFLTYCGCVIWQCLASPFQLAIAGAQITELPHGASKKIGITGPLMAKLSESDANFAAEQRIYLSPEALPYRAEYQATFPSGRRLIEDLSAYQTFSGITLPTLRRSWFADKGEPIRSRRAALDLEIFDAAFA